MGYVRRKRAGMGTWLVSRRLAHYGEMYPKARFVKTKARVAYKTILIGFPVVSADQALVRAVGNLVVFLRRLSGDVRFLPLRQILP